MGIECITLNNGYKKGDCENKAVKHLLKRLFKSKAFPNAIILGDALYANEPIGSMIKRYPGWDFICTSKPGSDKAVFDHIDGVQLDSIITNVTNVKTEAGRATWKTSWINGVTITHSKNAMKINFLSLDIIWARNRCAYKHVITKEDGKHFTWITSIEISPENSVGLASFGRARWNIENGTFNLLKNQGCGLEHNYAQGKTTLCYIIVSLMAIAFNSISSCWYFKNHGRKPRHWQEPPRLSLLS